MTPSQLYSHCIVYLVSLLAADNNFLAGSSPQKLSDTIKGVSDHRASVRGKTDTLLSGENRPFEGKRRIEDNTGGKIHSAAQTVTFSLSKGSSMPGDQYLPLKYLKAACNDSGQVKLIWETARNNADSQFIVERSFDGVNFVTAGVVTAGAGKHSYNEKPGNAANGLWYYRVKAITKGKSVFTSDFVPVKYSSPYEKVRILFANGEDSLELRIHTGISRFEITDASGKIIQTAKTEQDVKDIKIGDLPRGIYSINLYGSDTKVVQFLFRQ